MSPPHHLDVIELGHIFCHSTVSQWARPGERRQRPRIRHHGLLAPSAILMIVVGALMLRNRSRKGDLLYQGIARKPAEAARGSA